MPREHIDQTTLADHLKRRFCSAKILPIKVREIFAKHFIKSEKRCKPVEFQVPFGELKFYGSLNSHIDWRTFYFGAYDPVGLAFIRKVVPRLNNRICLDIGANVGNHMLLLAQCGSYVHCFEPYPKAIERLRNNVQLNGLEKVQIHCFGLSDKSEKIAYYENSANNHGAGSFEAAHTGIEPSSSQLLEVRVADEAFAELGITEFDFVKIDVEGHEPFVLRGMQHSIRRCRPILVTELGPTTYENLGGLTNLRALIPENYSLFRLCPGNRWTRLSARLIRYNYPDRGDIVAIPDEKKHLCSDLIMT